MVSRDDQRRREEAAQLLQYLTDPGYGLGWRPTLDDSGRPLPFAGATVEITPELIAALGREGDVFGRNTVVTSEAAQDVALTLRGEAVLTATAGGTAQ